MVAADHSSVVTINKPVDGRVNVRLQYKNGGPVAAILIHIHKHPGQGGRFASIRYKYSPDFFGGQFLVGFSRYSGNADDNEQLLYTIHLEELQLSSAHLSASEMDPRQVFKGQFQTTMVWSNGIPYSAGADGKLRPPQTSAEAKALQAQLQARAPSYLHPASGRTGSWHLLRIVLWCAVFGLAATGLTLYQWHRKKE